MKKIPIVLLLLLATFCLHAQDYNISFAGTGESASVGSVTVENLTQVTSITLSGTEILHLVGTSTALNPILYDVDKTLHIYPNPMTENSIVEFVATAPGMTNIELFDITGKRIAVTQNRLTIAKHSYKVSGLSTGIYTIRINSDTYNYTGKLVSNGTPGKEVRISYIGNNAIQVTAQKLKSATAEKTMQYTNGDLLKFTGSAGPYTTIMMDVPTGNKTLTFNFIACTDADGNNYPVVKIGNQWWMAENLKTTKFNDGTSIPFVTGNQEWIQLKASGYCWPNGDSQNKTLYGALYNWHTVNTGKLAPAGWHVPANAEWTELTTFLGDLDVAGGKMKETGVLHWKAANTGATNTSGFSGLPAGYRDFNGLFKDIANKALFWSATVANTGDAWLRELNYSSDNVISFDWYQILGYSVRCIKDETATTPNPLNVVVSLDAQLSVSSTITTDGGTLSATGADGTKYTLTFPKGALFGKEVITITPIAGIAGLHFSGPVVGGLQMAPDGLRLLKAAILTIESPKVVASAGFETVAFGYEKNGEGVFLSLPEIKGNTISMEIWHFSGGGAAQAKPAEVKTHYSQYIPSDEENAFYQRMSEYIGRQRQAQILGLPENPDLWTTIEKMAREAYDKFVAPLLPVALNDCAKAPAILSRALGCARQMALMGWNETIFEAEYQKIMETWQQVLLKCHGWKTTFPGCIGTTSFSCNTPFGPWDISCERPYLDGTQNYTLLIPYSSDGKSRVTETYYWTFPDSKNSTAIIISDITIDKENESYFINFKTLSETLTICVDGNCTTQEIEPRNSGKLIIYPANPGECW
jgi:uncharacterized protein (TIGR02145 family)